MAVLALPGVLKLFFLEAEPGGSPPHPEARQKGFLGKQKGTKYHMVSSPWGLFCPGLSDRKPKAFL